jgi:hypothetical protein
MFFALPSATSGTDVLLVARCFNIGEIRMATVRSGEAPK